jgi:adenylate cyclase, class 2
MSSPQPLEVEQKYRVSSHEVLRSRLKELGATPRRVEKHCDTYLQHPCRDFGQTGEAFRIREVNDDALVTFKGPRLEGAVKIRKELELPLASGTRQGWMSIFEKLGFKTVAQVRKTRSPFELVWRGHQQTVVLDEVERLGNFVEIEIVVEETTQLEEFEKSILSLAEELYLVEPEVRSYLRQLLALDRR